MKTILPSFLVVFGAVAGVLFASQGAAALSDGCWFNTTAGPVTGTGTCSVPGSYGNYGTNDLLRRDAGNRSTSGTGQAIPNSVNTKNEFITHVVQRYNGIAYSTAQNRVGAAFIIQAMRGSRAWPDNAAVSDWIYRMQDTDVTVHVLNRNVGRTGYYDTAKHNAFFAAHPVVLRQVIEVRYKGSMIAQVEFLCGNLVENSNGDLPQRWQVNPNTRMEINNDGVYRNRDNLSPYPVNVGDTVRWEHTIRNTGPGPTDNGVDWEVITNGTRTSPPSPTGTWGSGRPNNAVGPTASGARNINWTVPASEVGNLICQRIRNKAEASWSDTWTTSEWRCVRVNSVTYSIEATTDPTPTTFTNTPTAPVTGRVQAASGAVSDSHRVRLVAYKYDNSSIVSSGLLTARSASSQSPCSVTALQNVPTNEYADCRTTEAANPMSNYDGSPDPLAINASFADFGYTTPSGGYPLGTTFCFMISVENPTHLPGDDSQWYHSAPHCSTAAKQPKLQVHGGDLRVANTTNSCDAVGDQGYIRTSFTQLGGTYFGSWGEFGAFSQCNNHNFTTGTHLDNGRASVSALAGYHSLTFANNLAPPTPPPLFGRYHETSNTYVRGVAALTSCPTSSGVHTYTTFGAFKAAVSDLNAVTGTHCVNAGAATLVIDENIRLDTTPGDIGDIPQVVLIAGNVKIRENVEQVDAWLIASGDVSTCVNGSDNRYTQLSENRCSPQLIINGPVAAGGKLYADRTHGANDSADEDEAGEVFNLPASSVLWWYQQQSRTNARIDTVNVQELPPRY